MKILFLSKYPTSHIGGVEKHLKRMEYSVERIGHEITTISEEQIKPPHKKIIGLLYIWYWLFKNRDLITRCNLVHIHDVFIWYLPFRFLYPTKKVYITFHGWEGKFPIPLWNMWNKRIASKLTNGSIAVGKYIEKWYGIKADYIIHGGVVPTSLKLRRASKINNTVVYLGRLDADTGINEFKKWLTKHPELKVKYVTSDPNPEKFLKTAEYCVPSGYLSYLEAKSYGCKIITFASNPLKENYWKEIKLLKTIPTWDEVTKVYLQLWE